MSWPTTMLLRRLPTSISSFMRSWPGLYLLGKLKEESPARLLEIQSWVTPRYHSFSIKGNRVLFFFFWLPGITDIRHRVVAEMGAIFVKIFHKIYLCRKKPEYNNIYICWSISLPKYSSRRTHSRRPSVCIPLCFFVLRSPQRLDLLTYGLIWRVVFVIGPNLLSKMSFNLAESTNSCSYRFASATRGKKEDITCWKCFNASSLSTFAFITRCISA